MSEWTHVAGMIRVDSMCYEHEKDARWLERNRKENILEGILGPILIWKDGDEGYKEWKRISKVCKLPRGSEGSIEYKIITNFDTESITAFDIAIWGDLRDFGVDETHNIQRWFYNLCAELEENKEFHGVRMGVIYLTGNAGNITFTYY